MARILALLVKYGPGIAVIVAAVWTAVVWYIERRDRNSAEAKQQEVAMAAEAIRKDEVLRTSIRDSQRPFLEKQLSFYFEAAKITLYAVLPAKR